MDRQRTGRAAERAEVIRGILKRELSGASVRANTVRREQNGLYVSAVRQYKTWGRALAAAGLDAEKIFNRRTWTPRRIVQRIYHLHEKGVPLNHGAVVKADRGLVHAAYVEFGSWREALIEAGFEPARVRVVRPPWTKSEIVAAIQARVAEGASPTVNGLSLNSARFAINRLFGSFASALRCAGVLRRAQIPNWSRAKILSEIRERRDAGKPVYCLAILKSHSTLYSAARHHYGSWNAALRAAGIDPSEVRQKRPPWEAKTVIAELRRRAKCNNPAPTISAVNPVSLIRACIAFFGSLEGAARAAGVDAAAIARRGGTGNHRRRRRSKGQDYAR